MFALYLHNTTHKSARGSSDRIQDPSQGTAEHRAACQNIRRITTLREKEKYFPAFFSHTLLTKENALSAILFLQSLQFSGRF